jgi:SAM-dependent methyltransferase
LITAGTSGIVATYVGDNLQQTVYDSGFYESHTQGATRSARFLLDRLWRAYRPESIVDVGCGVGAWLLAAEILGVKTLRGFDGHWVAQDQILSDKIDFSPADLATGFLPLKEGEHFDLAICVEVAEHLPPDSTHILASSLTKAADVILFSAAIPYQGGNGHVNERWQSDWVHQFRHLNYEPFDIFRGAAWHEEDVDWWYAQNAVLYVSKELSDDRIDRATLRSLVEPVWNIAHPANYEGKSLKSAPAAGPTAPQG